MPFDGFGPHPSVGEYLWLQQQERMRQEYWADQAERERLAYEAAEEEELETSEAWQREVDRVVREQAREQREAEEREAARLREQAREQREAEERKRDAARLREQERRDRAVASGDEVELLFQHCLGRQFFHGPSVALDEQDTLLVLDGGGPMTGRTDAIEVTGAQVIRFPQRELGEALSVFPLTVVVQRIALELSEARGVSPDRFRYEEVPRREAAFEALGF